MGHMGPRHLTPAKRLSTPSVLLTHICVFHGSKTFSVKEESCRFTPKQDSLILCCYGYLSSLTGYFEGLPWGCWECEIRRVQECQARCRHGLRVPLIALQETLGRVCCACVACTWKLGRAFPHGSTGLCPQGHRSHACHPSSVLFYPLPFFTNHGCNLNLKSVPVNFKVDHFLFLLSDDCNKKLGEDAEFIQLLLKIMS